MESGCDFCGEEVDARKMPYEPYYKCLSCHISDYWEFANTVGMPDCSVTFMTDAQLTESWKRRKKRKLIKDTLPNSGKEENE
jgi:hypothetical protein